MQKVFGWVPSTPRGLQAVFSEDLISMKKKRGRVRRNHNGLKDTLACSLRASKLAGFVEPYKIARRGPLLCISLEAENLWD